MALTTLEAVKTALEIPSDDTSRDAVIEDAITDVTAVIARECKREFEPTADATRVFAWKGTRTLDLEPYDLRSITAFTFSPGSDDEASFTQGTDFELLPVASQWGTYTRVRFGLSRSCDLGEFGFVRVSIAGAWGFESVPDDVARAAKIAVSAWLEKGYGEQAADGWDEPRGTVPRPAPVFALPGASWRLLSPFARRQVY